MVSYFVFRQLLVLVRVCLSTSFFSGMRQRNDFEGKAANDNRKLLLILNGTSSLSS